ncbi:MAG TPA: lysophospholipid acyltransferase family protein [Draconibacterium sp.]|nr:lysophospholipid acyltransferase family protein [Draconibacterium sp.]
MKILRIIFLSPLALVRLLFVVFMSGYVVIIGWVWLKFFGFSRRLQQWVMRTWGKSILFVLGVKIDRNELPQTRNFILMPNHRSYIDIFIVAGLTPAALVGKAEIKKWPFGKLGAKVTNSILVDRTKIKSLVTTMNRIKDSVSQNIPVTLFPEGTTYKGPLTKPFKNGSFKIAADAGIPVIPMAIHYKDVNDAWVDKDTFVGHIFRQMGKPVSKVYIRYGSPIYNSDHKILQKETREQIDGMLTEIIDKKA